MTEEVITKAPTYEMVEGTEPSPDAPHEPRTLVRTDYDETVYMMTEIEDGVFVQWGECRNCTKRVDLCKCRPGPQMPPYITKWRDERFEKSIRHRIRKDEDENPEAEVSRVDAGLDAAIEAAKAAKEKEDV